MGAHRHEQSTRLGEHEDEDEKEKISFSSSFFITTNAQQKRGGDGGFGRAGADELRILTGTSQWVAATKESPLG